MLVTQNETKAERSLCSQLLQKRDRFFQSFNDVSQYVLAVPVHLMKMNPRVTQTERRKTLYFLWHWHEPVLSPTSQTWLWEIIYYCPLVAVGIPINKTAWNTTSTSNLHPYKNYTVSREYGLFLCRSPRKSCHDLYLVQHLCH